MIRTSCQVSTKSPHSGPRSGIEPVRLRLLHLQRVRLSRFGSNLITDRRGSTVSDLFGIAILSDFYVEITGDMSYAEVGQAQLAWIAGVNAWGTQQHRGSRALRPN